MTKTALKSPSVGMEGNARNAPKPVAWFDGQFLWQDKGFADPEKVSPEELGTFRALLSQFPFSHTQRIQQIDEALEAHRRESA